MKRTKPAFKMPKFNMPKFGTPRFSVPKPGRFKFPKLKSLSVETAMAVFVIATGCAWFGYQSLVTSRIQTAERSNLALSTSVTIQIQNELMQMAQHLSELADHKAPYRLGVGDWDVLSFSVWEPEASMRRIDRTAAIPQTSNLTTTQIQQLNSNAVHEWERGALAPVLAGNVVVSGMTHLGAGNAIWIGAPVGHAPVRKLAAAYFRMDRFARILRINPDVDAFILGGDSVVIASRNPRAVGKVDGDIAKHIRSDEVGNIEFTNSRGDEMLATYRRVPGTQLILVTSSPLSAVETSFWEVLGFAGIFFLIACAIFVTKSKVVTPQTVQTSEGTAERGQIATLFVSIWPVDRDIESIPPDAAKRLFSDIQKFGRAHIEQFGGSFEMASMTSFFGHWPGDHTVELAQCVLKLRHEYSKMNGIRKNDGFEALPIVFGASSGNSLRVTGGVAGVRVLGDAVSVARSLASLTAQGETDFLVSKVIWDSIEKNFLGSHFADGAYRVDGYESATGSHVLVASSVMPAVERTETRYMVNNGSQIIGPLTVGEIAQRLYCMDLDFDCECWVDGRGNRTTIGKSGMFGGSDDPDARFWVFDWENMHGPMTEGFLRTAVLHGVMKPEYSYCADSTALGWKPLSTWEGASEKEAA